MESSARSRNTLLVFSALTLLSCKAPQCLALTAEEWVTSIGSFETGQFAASGTTTLFGGGFEPTTDYDLASASPMSGWNLSASARGLFSALYPGTWYQDSNLAQEGTSSVLLQSRLQIPVLDDGTVPYLNSSSISMSLLFGYPLAGHNVGPTLLENQRYELSFWMRDFGASSGLASVRVAWLEHDSPPELSYQESTFSSPLYPTDQDGNPLPLNVNDANVPWVEKRFTFDTIGGAGLISIGQSHGFRVDGVETYTAAFFDNFRLTPVPEPSSALLIAVGLGWELRRRRHRR